MKIQTQNKKIIVTGSLAFDTIMDFDGEFCDHILPGQLHKINLSFLATDMQKTNGGTAGNIAYNLGLLENKPILLSMFGKEAKEYREFLSKHGVDVSLSPISKKLFSSQAFILTDKTDNQIASFYPGSMNENSSLSVIASEPVPYGAGERGNLLNENTTKKIASSPAASRNDNVLVVISPNIPEAMNNFVHQCTDGHIPFMYDPGMQLPRLTDEDLREGIQNCEILIGNDYEMELMKSRMGELNVPILVTTLGEKGAVIFERSEKIDRHSDPAVAGEESSQGRSFGHKFPQDDEREKQHVVSSAKPRKIIDPTGAGDAFRAGFLAGYSRNFDLKICGQMGATAAVYTVEKYGTQTHSFTLDDFCKRYHDNYDVQLSL